MSFAFFGLGGVFTIFALVFFLVGHNRQAHERLFEEQKTVTTAKITNWMVHYESNLELPEIELTINGELVTARLKASRMTAKTHPVGTSVRVAYIVEQTIIGARVDARADEDGHRPGTDGAAVKIFYGVSFAFMAAAVISFVLAIAKIS